MLFVSIAQDYFIWHYSRALMQIFHVWFNFIWFTVHFFSIPKLIRSWLAPWKRMTEHRNGSWSFEDVAGVIVIGALSRLIGFIMRTIVICMGLVSLAIVTVGGFLFYIIWLAMPVVIIMALVVGLTFLFR